MKIIEALKQIKDLQRKASDIKDKVKLHCSMAMYETPVYGSNQEKQVSEWIQAHEDIIREVLRLRIAVQRTNLVTSVEIEIGEKKVNKTIAEWIHRRKDLAALDGQVYAVLGDKGLREGTIVNSMQEKVEVKIVRFFDPVNRDKKVEMYRSEPSLINAKLEVVNAVTDVIE